MLIHGLAGSWRAWQPVLPTLQARHDVLAVGLAGHAGCERLGPGVAPSVAALTDVVERDLDRAGISQAHIAGNSLGGWIALELAKRGRARSVVAISPAGGWGPDRFLRVRAAGTTLAQRGCRVVAAQAPWVVRLQPARHLFLRPVVAHPDRVSVVDALDGLHAVAGCTIFGPLLRSLLSDGPATDLDRVRVPALFAWPELDRMLPVDHARRYASRVAGAEFVVLPGAGHVPMSDAPALVASTIIDFAAEVRARPVRQVGA